jgi:hypothetical protein
MRYCSFPSVLAILAAFLMVMPSTLQAVEGLSNINIPFFSWRRSERAFFQGRSPELYPGKLAYLRLSDPTRPNPLYLTGDSWTGGLRFGLQEITDRYSAECTGKAVLYFDAVQGTPSSTATTSTAASDLLGQPQDIRVSLDKVTIAEYLPHKQWKTFLGFIGSPDKRNQLPPPVNFPAMVQITCSRGPHTVTHKVPITFGLSIEKLSSVHCFWRLTGTCSFPLTGTMLGMNKTSALEAQLVFCSDAGLPVGAAHGGESLEESLESGSDALGGMK